MNIAIPDSALYAPLVAHAEEVCSKHGWKLIRTDIEQCGRMLLSHTVDVALVSPIGYGRGVGKVDYRIVAGPAVHLHDFTNVAGIHVYPHATNITRATTATPAEFIVILGSLLLAEKLDTEVTLLQSDDAADCSIDIVQANAAPMLDVSEEWSDMVGAPLPTALWVCRIEADLDSIADAVSRMADDTTEVPVVEMPVEQAEIEPRAGRITYRWSEESEEALTAVLDLLFYHQVLPEIPAVKLLGRD